MPTIRFANILLEENPRALECPGLYVHATGRFQPLDIADNNPAHSVWSFAAHSSFNFMTYFNALSVGKLREYASAQKFTLTVTHKGGQAHLQPIIASVYSHTPQPQGAPVLLPASQDWHSVDIELPCNADTVLASFVLTTEDEPVELTHSYYSVSVEQQLRDVNLVLSTTTFKKESYVRDNIAKVEAQLCQPGDELADHFHMYVIDNGRTLPVDELSDEHVTIRPNKNVGGAGGFARGMIEAMEQEKPATHIILMDDDVSIAPESIRRTYNLLRIVNDEYKEALISGSMLNFIVPNLSMEDTGWVTPQGPFAPLKPQLDANNLDDLIYNETFEVPKDIQRRQRYAGWWYCCIPISVIQRVGLPLPFFIRSDDTEYGTRTMVPLMSMNGIGIWHMPFYIRYSAAVERYQTIRNTLTAQFTTGFAPDSNFIYQVHNFVRLELKKFGYANARLVLDAFEDFLKGPEFYSAKGMAEKTFLAANKNQEKLVDYAQLQKQTAALGLDFDPSHYTHQLVDSDRPRSYAQRIADYVTDNGQRFLHSQGEGYVVIPTDGWSYPAGVIRGKKYIIVVDWYSQKGAVRQKDIKQFKEIQARYRRDMRYFKAHEKQLRARYEASRSQVTSLEFWKNYLDMK